MSSRVLAAVWLRAGRGMSSHERSAATCGRKTPASEQVAGVISARSCRHTSSAWQELHPLGLTFEFWSPRSGPELRRRARGRPSAENRFLGCGTRRPLAEVGALGDSFVGYNLLSLLPHRPTPSGRDRQPQGRPAAAKALGGQFSARRRPRGPPPSRPPGRNPTPVGGAVTCFSSRLSAWQELHPLGLTFEFWSPRSGPELRRRARGRPSAENRFLGCGTRRPLAEVGALGDSFVGYNLLSLLPHRPTPSGRDRQPQGRPAAAQALGGQFSARRRPRGPPPSRPPGRNPTPVGGAVTCFSSRLLAGSSVHGDG
eukprot:CAMPEP_0181196128 /NCGR_PEP_ID=MMETSP1096-20121128/15280_1 /TAXON_ID=156174 ORGANISM="Chrysochromulina ericina, Strain CCMP281" /NCGR_SAMPLE_ID=MMETSP1096 /ASSEMBLY_ACC=CAM_ASM_000453 /LENGTH=312 /DNA_ID=CAMNT_0023285827 /DNA_START=183 /DNA_END=1118 /DNA_ORIENTATION=+